MQLAINLSFHDWIKLAHFTFFLYKSTIDKIYTKASIFIESSYFFCMNIAHFRSWQKKIVCLQQIKLLKFSIMMKSWNLTEYVKSFFHISCVMRKPTLCM